MLLEGLGLELLFLRLSFCESRLSPPLLFQSRHLFLEQLRVNLESGHGWTGTGDLT